MRIGDEFGGFGLLRDECLVQHAPPIVKHWVQPITQLLSRDLGVGGNLGFLSDLHIAPRGA
jgi:hypothetical protein